MPAHIPIRFETYFTETPYSRVATDAGFGSIWEEADEIGIFAVRRTPGSSAELQQADNHIHNIRLTYNGGVWSPDNGTELMFPSGDVLLDFYAYHPYDDNGGNPQGLDPTAIAFTVKTDQEGTTGGSQKSGYALSDLLTAVSEGIPKTANPVILTFSHALSLVQVDISNRDAGVPEYRADKLTVTLKGVKAVAVLNLGEQGPPAVTVPQEGNEPQDIVMARVTDAGGERWLYRAIVPAQTVPPGVLFRFEQETDGIPGISAADEFGLEYSITSPKPLTAGNAAKYEITLIPE